MVFRPLVAASYIHISASGTSADLVCNYSTDAFCTSLTYNVLLVLACAYCAFKTRHLPDNFNESRFIVFCVYSQLLLWMIFIPAYFAVGGSRYQVLFLCLILIVNSTLILSSLYIPKLYAVYFVKKRDMRLDRRIRFNTSTKRFVESMEESSAAGQVDAGDDQLGGLGLPPPSSCEVSSSTTASVSFRRNKVHTHSLSQCY